MVDLIDGFTPYAPRDVEQYQRLGWWQGLTFGDILDRAADRFPDKKAFVDPQGALTYAQARDRADRFAISLMDLGIRPQERVLLQLPNWNDFAVVSVAAVLDVADGVCREACIVLGAVAPTPYRAVGAQKIIRGGPLNADRARSAAEAALKDAKPMSKNAYKIEIAKTLIRRVLLGDDDSD